MGGVVVGYEMGRQLGVPAIFFERVAGKFELRRGFEIEPGQRCLMVEDVVTTGLSSRECIEAAQALGRERDRRGLARGPLGGKASLPVPFVSLISLDIPHFPPDQLPASLQDIPRCQTRKPGLEGLRRGYRLLKEALRGWLFGRRLRGRLGDMLFKRKKRLSAVMRLRYARVARAEFRAVVPL